MTAAISSGVAAVWSLTAWLRLDVAWRRHLAAFISGAASVLALAPFFLWPVLFLTVPVLVWSIDAVTGARAWRQSALSGWVFGFGYFIAGLFWVGEAFLVEAEKFAWALPLAVTLLPAGLALFWAGAAAAAARFSVPGWSRILTLAATLSAAEWLRGHVLTGFPWNLPGYALAANDVLMQSAAIVGVYGLTFMAVIVFASPLVILERHNPAAGAWSGVAMSAGILAIMAAFGWWRLPTAPVANVDSVRLRIVQPSVVQREKWQAAKQREIFARHLNMSRQNPAGRVDDLAGVTHVIWPEAAMPFLPLERPEALEAIAALLPPNVRLLTGALRLRPLQPGSPEVPIRDRVALNSLIVFDENGSPSAIYDKIHLVPFGEYLPLRSLLTPLGIEKLTRGHGSFAAGPQPRPLLVVAGLPPAGPLICYEALFPGEAATFTGRPQFLLNVTNDGWFGKLTGPYQHFHQARVRAVEQGVPLIRAANNGISGVIDPYGRVVQELGIDVRGTIDSALPKALAPPLYNRAGDTLFGILLLASFCLAFAVNRRSVNLQTTHQGVTQDNIDGRSADP